jgi:hypothetical protein
VTTATIAVLMLAMTYAVAVHNLIIGELDRQAP